MSGHAESRHVISHASQSAFWQRFQKNLLLEIKSSFSRIFLGIKFTTFLVISFILYIQAVTSLIEFPHVKTVKKILGETAKPRTI